VLFKLNAPLAGWADRRARESVSESTALAWLLGRHALLFLAVLWVHMASGYAKAITVVEERGSAILAFLSSLAFCLRHFLRTFGHYLAVVAGGVVLLAVWAALDGRWETVGYKTQLVTFALFQALVFGRMMLRLGLLGGQIALYRRHGPNGS
jgi:hypothetical protein